METAEGDSDHSWSGEAARAATHSHDASGQCPLLAFEDPGGSLFFVGVCGGFCAYGGVDGVGDQGNIALRYDASGLVSLFAFEDPGGCDCFVSVCGDFCTCGVFDGTGGQGNVALSYDASALFPLLPL